MDKSCTEDRGGPPRLDSVGMSATTVPSKKSTLEVPSKEAPLRKEQSDDEETLDDSAHSNSERNAVTAKQGKKRARFMDSDEDPDYSSHSDKSDDDIPLGRPSPPKLRSGARAKLSTERKRKKTSKGLSRLMLCRLTLF